MVATLVEACLDIPVNGDMTGEFNLGSSHRK